ncbi:MAG: hypothetical protein R3A48_22975 [Polyangiales bacterium]
MSVLRAACLALLGCAAHRPPTPVTPAPAPEAPAPTPAAVAPPPRPAHLRVLDALADAPELDADDAAWLPARILGALVDATGALPSPTPPRRSEGRVTWSLLAQPEAGDLSGACAAITRFDPRVACATDTVQWAGSERPRVALGWRAAEARVVVGLAQPLRALSRLAPGACLVSAQNTLRTLDILIRTESHPALGRTLAALAAAPGLSDLMLVRAEPAGAQVQALLSWPTERARGPAELGEVPWPSRCDGASRVGGDAASATLPAVRGVITGTAAQGAVLSLGRQSWLVTAGDSVGDAVVQSVTSSVVTLTRRGRPPLRLRVPATPREGAVDARPASR